ncbi:hypothetical protein M422DRAFT_22747 [Sphaerobolus stellatus SS14]|nr:hypothetical protein M422DRAFT_22747 [Sphaerobolus stellatus SS14]
MALPSPEDIRLIISDVDGTLLTSNHEIHPRTLNAFAKLRAARPDLPIVIASGKQYHSCALLRKALNLPDHFPSVHCNGALIHGGPNGTEVCGTLTPESVLHIVNGTTSYGTFIFTEDSVTMISGGTGIHKQDWCTIAGKYDFDTVDKSQEPERSVFLQKIASGEIAITKVTVCIDIVELEDALSNLNALANSSAQQFKVTRAIPWILEAIPPDVSKGRGLSQLCKSLNISPKQVLAFGDGENDISMFKVAGHPVAMGNSMPAAAAVALYVTDSNDEGGVGGFIEKVWGF